MRRPSWEVITRSLAVIGFLVTLPLLVEDPEAIPLGWFILLVGLFFGPDAYHSFGPGRDRGE